MRTIASWREHLRRVRRRAITLPILFLLTVVMVAALPISIPLFGLVDLVRPTRPWARCRAILAFAWIACCEALGVVAAFCIWLWFLLHRGDERFAEHNTQLQRRWTSALFKGACVIYRMRVLLDGVEEASSHGAMILLVRHASSVDTVLAAAVLANPIGLRLRYVLKMELLGDPCIDIVGNRLPNVFVSRSSKSVADLADVHALAQGLGADEGVLIYPEGTRFSKRKLAKLQGRLSDDPVLGPSALAMRHVLPPRPGGTLALLQAAPEVDVVILAHTGLEGAATLADVWRGELVEAQVRIAAWRIAAADVPAQARENPEWLLEKWREVDDWIERQSR